MWRGLQHLVGHTAGLPKPPKVLPQSRTIAESYVWVKISFSGEEIASSSFLVNAYPLTHFCKGKLITSCASGLETRW